MIPHIGRNMIGNENYFFLSLEIKSSLSLLCVFDGIHADNSRKKRILNLFLWSWTAKSTSHSAQQIIEHEKWIAAIDEQK